MADQLEQARQQAEEGKRALLGENSLSKVNRLVIEHFYRRKAGGHPGVAVPVPNLLGPLHLARLTQLWTHLLLALPGAVAEVSSKPS